MVYIETCPKITMDNRPVVCPICNFLIEVRNIDFHKCPMLDHILDRLNFGKRKENL